MTKVFTGIRGFDEITGGGLPQGRTSLVMGGAGCGKTVFALQSLVAEVAGVPGTAGDAQLEPVGLEENR
jgi:circadian clock protein KaiC